MKITPQKLPPKRIPYTIILELTEDEFLWFGRAIGCSMKDDLAKEIKKQFKKDVSIDTIKKDMNKYLFKFYSEISDQCSNLLKDRGEIDEFKPHG